MSALRLREVDAAAVRPLRGAVLRPGQPPAAAVWPGDDDPRAVHVAAYEEGSPEPLGVVTLLPAPYPGPGGGDGPHEPQPLGSEAAGVEVGDEPGAGGGTVGAYQLRGMAVAPDRQGSGVGAAVLAAALESLRRRGVDLVWCNARLSVAAFYERAGFARDGGVFVHPPLDIPHVRMHRPVG